MMVRKYVAIVFLALMAMATVPLHAQDSSGIIKSWMQQLQARYRNAGYLSFHIRYLYANSGPSAAPLDSLSGDVEMHGTQCRLVIDGTETLVTDKYTIQVRPDEKIIILSTTHPTGNLDPVGLMDSLLKHTGQAKPHLQRQPGQEILSISFPPGREYSGMRVVTDAGTGYLQRVSYMVQTAAWVGQEMISRPGRPAPYQTEGRIDMEFSRYRKNGFDASLFNTENYFTKVDGRYEAAARFKDYQIFLASSNL